MENNKEHVGDSRDKEGKVSKRKLRRETPSVPLLSGRLNMNGTKQNQGLETLRVLAILLATVA